MLHAAIYIGWPPPALVSLMVLAPLSLIDDAKVQNIMLLSKRFLDLVLNVNKYYLLIIHSFTNPKDIAIQSRRKFGRFCKIIVNYPPDSAEPVKRPVCRPRWYAGTLVHFVKLS